MKISRLIIPDFQQFKDFDLDLTHPQGHEKAGEPLDKVCFIGGNGTGKSTLLEMLHSFLTLKQHVYSPSLEKAIIKLEIEDKQYYWVQQVGTFFEESIQDDNSFKWLTKALKGEAGHLIANGELVFALIENPSDSIDYSINKFKEKRLLEIFDDAIRNRYSNCHIYIPAEFYENNYAFVSDVPSVTLDESLAFFSRFPRTNIISSDTVGDFWRMLIYHLKKRENDYREFEGLPENQLKTVKVVRELFEKEHPDILRSLASFWNKILNKAGLEFDYENAKNPVQLNENLRAYIRLKDSGKQVNYNQLSTGIRNFIFKLGHIFALYFNRNIESGFLLVDEPENSLFPDFLYDLVDTYTGIAKNTQIFMATHNPIIAAQFQPYERFILEFEEGTGHVKVRRGTTPVGDDPNDILIKDFGIRSILGREGVKKWERYIELKTLIPLEHDPANKNRMIEEFMQIGSDYNFAADAVS